MSRVTCDRVPGPLKTQIKRGPGGARIHILVISCILSFLAYFLSLSGSFPETELTRSVGAYHISWHQLTFWGTCTLIAMTWLPLIFPWRCAGGCLASFSLQSSSPARCSYIHMLCPDQSCTHFLHISVSVHSKVNTKDQRHRVSHGLQFKCVYSSSISLLEELANLFDQKLEPTT